MIGAISETHTSTITAIGSGQRDSHGCGYRLSWTYRIDDTWTIRTAIHHRDDTPEPSFCAVSLLPRNSSGPGTALPRRQHRGGARPAGRLA